MKYIAWIILTATITFNLWLYYPETQILGDPNDNNFQYSLVARTDWVWQQYGCPLSAACLTNLVDHNVPAWAEGYPLPFYYSHIPQILTVASYRMLIEPLSALTLFQYYNWTKYLLLCFFPLPVFFALSLIGFSPFLAAISAFFAAHLSTDGLYGIDPPSFLWRGYGLTSQLYAMAFIPLALAFTYKALILENSKSEVRSSKHIPPMKMKNSNLRFVSNFGFRTSDLLPAIIFLSATIAGHLGIGIIAILSLWPFLFFDAKRYALIIRFRRLCIIGTAAILLLSYWIIPVLLYNTYHMVSFWDPIWKFDSYGWYEVIRQLFAGEIFDWGRFPVITGIVLTGLFASALSKERRPFAMLFVFWFLLYFGRTTWGGFIDVIPGMKDFHQHRFIVAIHITSLFLIPEGMRILGLGVRYAVDRFQPLLTTLFAAVEKASREEDGSPHAQQTAVPPSMTVVPVYWVLCGIILAGAVYITAQQTVAYNSLNSRWIGEANIAFRHDEKNFDTLVTRIKSLPSGRTYAGRPGNWGKQLRLGSSELYMLLGTRGIDMSQFLPETWSPMSENEQNFDERVDRDYDLLNIRYIVSNKNQDFPSQAQLKETIGPFQLYEIPTSGWFKIVTSPMMVVSDKTNFLNIVQLWHRSYARLWNMYPILSLKGEKPAPFPVQKTINMIDEVSYIDNQRPKTSDQRLNIFADYPFVFPEATPSGSIKKESVKKQTYAATVNVSDPCNACMVLFKMSYHPDWEVKVDGKPADKYMVFPAYLATPVSPGTHTVEWTYKPNRLKVFLLVFTGAAVAVISVWNGGKKLRNSFWKN